MRPRTLAVLAVVVGALLAFIYFAEDKVASTDERAAAAKRLMSVEPDEIVGLEIEWQDSRVSFERPAKSAGPLPETAESSSGEPADPPAGRHWRVVAPFGHLADSAAVDRLLTALTGLEAIRQLEDAARPDIGLAPPRGTVSWKTATGSGKLEIGGNVPASREVVVAVSGREAPAVTSDAFLSDLSRPPGDWRDRRVVTASRERIERLALASATGENVVLVRSGETLRLESPIADQVDRDLADRLLSDLAALRMDAFLDPPLSEEVEKALTQRAGTIELAVSGESEPLRIEAGGEMEAGRRVWRAGSQAFESASSLGDVLARPAGEWRSRSWTRFENWRIEKARIEEGAGAFELIRSNGEWLRDGKKIPFAVASDLLAALTSAKAESLVERPAGDSTATPPPKLAVTLSDADGNEELLTLYESRDLAPAVPARTRGREVELLLPRDLVTELEKRVSAVRAAVPSPPDA